MSEMKRIRRCPGCGVILQSIDETLEGYVPEKHMLKHEVIICQRCFKLQHYGEETSVAEPPINEEFLVILKQAKKEKALIVYVLDLFTFESSFSKEINQEIAGLKVIAVATKRDLLPKSVKDDKLKEYVLNRLKIADLKVIDLFIASPLDNHNIDDVSDAIKAHRGKHNIYVIGAASSGKSSLVNGFIRHFTNTTQNLITTSPFPGTTLRVIDIPLDEKTYLFDTPGFNLDSSLIGKVEKEVIRAIMPKIEIKPRTFQLNEKQSIILGGLGRLDFLKGKRTGFTVFASPKVDVRRSSLILASKTFNSLIKNKRTTPITHLVKDEKDLEAFEITVSDTEKLDVGIIGLGWITFIGSGQTLRILAPKGVGTYMLPAKI